VGYRDLETGKHDRCWTTAFQLADATLAARDKARWPVELVFNAMTQPLKSKTFLGPSENAVMPPSGAC
jgi:IS4 transposase